MTRGQLGNDSNERCREAISWLMGFLQGRTGVRAYSDPMIFARSRLAPLLRRHGLSDISELCDAVAEGHHVLTEEVLSALTTHESSFYRNANVFRWLEREGLQLVRESARPGGPVRAWSAGCSSGEEVLSLAMLMKDRFSDLSWEILASDVSRTAIERARRGRYSTVQVNRGLGARQLLRWFSRDGAAYVASNELMKHIDWRVHNLVADPPLASNLDLVLFRNVLIYFNEADRRAALDCVARAMRPGAVLVLGHAEGMMSAVAEGPFTARRHGALTYFTKS